MRIAFIWTKGGPDHWDDRDFETGIGGSEALMILYARTFAKYGHDVVVFAPTDQPGIYNGVEYKPVVDDDHFDAVISIREAGPLYQFPDADIRAVLATQPYLSDIPQAVGAGACNLVITISPYQTKLYRKERPDIADVLYQSSAGVNLEDYTVTSMSKNPYLCLYSATPERGMSHLIDIWPRIKADAPRAELAITGGLQLYGWSDDSVEDRFGDIYNQLRDLDGVRILGTLPRSDLVLLQRRTLIYLYPSTHDEMCCINILEAMAARMAAVTTNRGAVADWIEDGKTGYLLDGTPGERDYNDKFVQRAVSLLKDPALCGQIGTRAHTSVLDHNYDILYKEWIKKFKEVANA